LATKGVLGSSDLFIVKCHALHQFYGVNALLKTYAAQIVESEPSKGNYGSAVEHCLIKPIHQMDCARACRSDADAEAAGVLGKT
jgi:hypothetical protein